MVTIECDGAGSLGPGELYWITHQDLPRNYIEWVSLQGGRAYTSGPYTLVDFGTEEDAILFKLRYM